MKRTQQTVPVDAEQDLPVLRWALMISWEPSNEQGPTHMTKNSLISGEMHTSVISKYSFQTKSE